MKPMPDETLEKLLYYRQEIDKIFQEFFDRKADSRPAEQAGVELPVDIFEHKEELVVVVELAGVRREDLSLSALRDILILEGVKRPEETGSRAHFVCAEREFGSFRRIIELPTAGDMSRAEAKLTAGVLTIRLPRIPERRGRKIQITIG